VGSMVAAQGDEGDLFPASALNGPAADDALRVGVQDDLEQHGRRISRCAGVVVAKALVEA
jgi:hypothetical protein